MGTYTLQEAQADLAALIDKARHGETVLITDGEKPAVGLAPAGPSNRLVESERFEPGSYEWLRARRLARPALDLSSADLIASIREEDDERLLGRERPPSHHR